MSEFSGFADNCDCPHAIAGNKSDAVSRSLLHCETALSAISNLVFICSHTPVLGELRKQPGTASRISPSAMPYIWFGVPSDHTPVGIRNILIGSGLPLYDGANKSGDPGNVSARLFEESTTFAPHTVPSGV
jgi:hypothetical protein